MSYKFVNVLGSPKCWTCRIPIFAYGFNNHFVNVSPNDVEWSHGDLPGIICPNNTKILGISSCLEYVLSRANQPSHKMENEMYWTALETVTQAEWLTAPFLAGGSGIVDYDVYRSLMALLANWERNFPTYHTDGDNDIVSFVLYPTLSFLRYVGFPLTSLYPNMDKFMAACETKVEFTATRPQHWNQRVHPTLRMFEEISRQVTRLSGPSIHSAHPSDLRSEDAFVRSVHASRRLGPAYGSQANGYSLR
eukprot:PhF_6_TR4187/c0_g1_i2/m.5630